MFQAIHSMSDENLVYYFGALPFMIVVVIIAVYSVIEDIRYHANQRISKAENEANKEKEEVTILTEERNELIDEVAELIEEKKGLQGQIDTLKTEQEEMKKVMVALTETLSTLTNTNMSNMSSLLSEFKKITEYIGVLKNYFPQLQERTITIGSDPSATWTPTFAHSGDTIILKYNIVDVMTNKCLNDIVQSLSIIMPETKTIAIPAGAKLAVLSARNKSPKKFIYLKDITHYAKEALEYK
jgi:predicted RNase H-like nuclease (RuvC/YqgF family)